MDIGVQYKMIITEQQIEEYINEEKILPAEFKPIFKDRNNQNFFEKNITCETGNEYKIIIRQSQINPLDFSIIFGIIINGKIFRIKRYNGDSHGHTNKLEDEQLEGFHIHVATERYQKRGFQPEGFAKSTSTYSDWQTALKVMLRENNFKIKTTKDQKRLEKWN
jgi:hypothetical protein